MRLTRRTFVASAGGLVLLTPAARAAQRFGLDAAHFGVHAGAPGEQTQSIQRAIDAAARARLPLWLVPGVYRAGALTLPAGAQITGVRGATRLMLTQGPSLIAAEHADHVALTGLALDGASLPLPDGRGLIHIADARQLRIEDCAIVHAGGNAIALEQCDGEVSRCTITGAADNALFCNDSRGMTIADNTIRGSGNGGIRVWQSVRRHDGSSVTGNSVDDTSARAGGSGQNGNAINVYRAAGVIVRGNHVSNAAFSGIRAAAASNILIAGNQCRALDEVAIYCEFEFENAVIADNIVDTAGSGISVTNFKEGGRLAAVRGNVVRNLRVRRQDQKPEDVGVGISVEADTSVTGNTIENAQIAGISAGWGEYLRDVAISGNVVRACGIGVAVSVVKGAGTATITGNQLAGSRIGAIVGMEWHKAVTGDLTLGGAKDYPQLKIDGNQVS